MTFAKTYHGLRDVKKVEEHRSRIHLDRVTLNRLTRASFILDYIGQ